MNMRITSKDLRKSILQYAFEGKLIPQDPADEPVSILLKKICDGKKEHSSRICKRDGSYFEFSHDIEKCIDDEIPFEIPDNWEWTRLGTISDYDRTKEKVNSGTINAKSWELDLEDIEKGGRVIVKKTAEEKRAIGDKTVFHKGDILYSKLRPYLLKILVATEDGVCSPEIVPFSIYGGISSEYVVNYLKSPYVDSYINGNTYGVKMPRVGTKTMLDLFVPIPPITEQQRIVRELERYEELLSEYECLEKELSNLDANIHDKLWKSILQYALEGKLVSQKAEEGTAATLINKIYAEKRRLERDGVIKKTNNESVFYRDSDGRYCEKKNNSVTDVTDEIPFDIPESWVWSRLDDIVVVNPRNSLSDGQESSFVEMSAIKEGYCSRFTYVVKPWGKIKSGYTHFCDGDVGFAKITPCFQNRKSVVFRNLKNGYGAGTTELNILRPYGETILPEYLLWFVKSPYFIQRGISNLSGTAGQQRFGTDSVKSTLIPIPPYDEQKRIVDEIEKYESLLGGLGDLV